MRCPCGRGPGYDDCCAPYHRGEATAPTAERLMRSRYTAFARRDEAYLLRTWHPDTRPVQLSLDPQQQWLHLDVAATTGGGLLHTEGTVEFTAHWMQGRRRGSRHENSRFVRIDGEWCYLDALD